MKRSFSDLFPACASLTHNARHSLADMLFHRRAPGNQREIARPFDERMASACHFDGSYQISVNRFAVLGFNKWLPNLIRSLAGDAHQLALLEGCEHPTLIDGTPILFLSELLGDRTSVVSGKRVSVRVDLGVRCIITQEKKT